MRRIFEAVRADGWPVAFAFVFDDFWTIAVRPGLPRSSARRWAKPVFRTPSSGRIGYRANGASPAGGPHEDYRDVGETFLSLWIPLSDITVENGCMCLLPGASSREISMATEERRDLPPTVFRRALQDVIALPASAGSMIGWRGDVLHWGGANTGGSEPRLCRPSGCACSRS